MNKLFLNKIFVTAFIFILSVMIFSSVMAQTPSVTPAPSAPSLNPVPTYTDLTRTSVTLRGEVTGGSNPTERGFEYGTSIPYAYKVKENGYFSPNPFSLPVTGLEPDTTYHYRAYALNTLGKSYSNDATFKTNASPTSLSGWAWSSNIGWVFLDTVGIDQTTGNMDGYAWSSNIGWIKFGGLGDDYPTNGAPGVPANINFTTGEIKGWARACAGTINKDCASASRTDGWDGWIELAGTNHPSRPGLGGQLDGLSMNPATGAITGMAWGSSVIGWLSFDASVVRTSMTAACNAIDLGNGTMQFSASASGGSRNYVYKWGSDPWGASSLSPTRTFSSNSGVITTPLLVSDDNGVTSMTPTPTCSFTPPTLSISATCSMNKNNIKTGESIVYTVSNIQPASTYRYTYFPSTAGPVVGSGPSYTHTYNEPATGYTTSVRLTDISSGPTANTSATFNCGRVTVTQPGLNLFIGSPSQLDSAISGVTMHSVRKGEQFKLVWENTLTPYNPVSAPDGYRCLRFVNGANSDWNGEWAGEITTNDSSGAMNTTNTGRYTFLLSCQQTGAFTDRKQATSTLRVFTPTGTEI